MNRYITTELGRIAAAAEDKLAEQYVEGAAITYHDGTTLARAAMLEATGKVNSSAINVLPLLSYVGVLEPIYEENRIRPTGFLVHHRAHGPEVNGSEPAAEFNARQHRRLAHLADELEGRPLRQVIDEAIERWASAP